MLDATGESVKRNVSRDFQVAGLAKHCIQRVSCLHEANMSRFKVSPTCERAHPTWISRKLTKISQFVPFSRISKSQCQRRLSNLPNAPTLNFSRRSRFQNFKHFDCALLSVDGSLLHCRSCLKVYDVVRMIHRQNLITWIFFQCHQQILRSF